MKIARLPGRIAVGGAGLDDRDGDVPRRECERRGQPDRPGADDDRALMRHRLESRDRARRERRARAR